MLSLMWAYRYVLTPRATLNSRAAAGPRHGALLYDGEGFADVHPWPELGDAPLDEQLDLLARDQTTALTARSLAFMQIDAALRQAGRSAFEGLTIPASHYPAAASDEVPDAFDTVKIKCGPQLDPVGLERWRGRRLRLDFNATLTAEQFLGLVPALRRHEIDFVEDPCPYDAKVWARLRAESGLRLALDRGSAGDEAEVMVVKPAVQELDSFILDPSSAREVVVTSYMDHAFGQMCAAWVAAKNADRLSARCGLFTHVLFEPDAFFERVGSRGSSLLPAAGTGFGFDDLLHNLPWKTLT